MEVDWNSQALSPHLRDKLENAIKSPATANKGFASIKPPGKYDINAEPEGVIDNPNDFHKDYHGSSVLICKDIGDFLLKTYPGWAWVVQLNEFGHMIYITNQHLHPTMGARIRMEDVMFDVSRKIIKQQAGELLERFGMARHGLSGENLSRLVNALRDVKGNCIPEISDLKDKKAATQAEIAKKVARGEITIYEVNGTKYARIKR